MQLPVILTTVFQYRLTSICQTCLSRKHHLCRSDVPFLCVIVFKPLYVELAYLENSAISKWFSFLVLSLPLVLPLLVSKSKVVFRKWSLIRRNEQIRAIFGRHSTARHFFLFLHIGKNVIQSEWQRILLLTNSTIVNSIWIREIWLFAYLELRIPQSVFSIPLEFEISRLACTYFTCSVEHGIFMTAVTELNERMSRLICCTAGSSLQRFVNLSCCDYISFENKSACMSQYLGLLRYLYDLKFFNRLVWTNSADPGHRVFYSNYIISRYHTIVVSLSLNFSMFTLKQDGI